MAARKPKAPVFVNVGGPVTIGGETVEPGGVFTAPKRGNSFDDWELKRPYFRVDTRTIEELSQAIRDGFAVLDRILALAIRAARPHVKRTPKLKG